MRRVALHMGRVVASKKVIDTSQGRMMSSVATSVFTRVDNTEVQVTYARSEYIAPRRILAKENRHDRTVSSKSIRLETLHDVRPSIHCSKVHRNTSFENNTTTYAKMSAERYLLDPLLHRLHSPPHSKTANGAHAR